MKDLERKAAYEKSYNQHHQRWSTTTVQYTSRTSQVWRQRQRCATWRTSRNKETQALLEGMQDYIDYDVDHLDFDHFNNIDN
eukprot:5926440-Amphidinium_carterae.1